ncbi:hypothetical protein NC653_013790 [Populus alba x Populus x berolinensis]|uniref:Uncharacterized protein n=1 Tax=Populus alba x Populus x berolinensis TaxID=444605 RepID=A0AAD6W2X9_9ROSI|nr:hypothetical protein NC653_013790 [Populus alba x Populus x berolinensis]
MTAASCFPFLFFFPCCYIEKSSSLRKTKSQIFTNSSACKLKLGDIKGALLDTDFAMRDGEDNAKAFFRQGQAYMALNDIDAAVASLKKALDLEPNDGGIKKELASARKKVNKLSAVLSLFLNVICYYLLLGPFTFDFSHVRLYNQRFTGLCLRNHQANWKGTDFAQFFGYTLCTGRRLSLLLYLLKLNRLVYTMDILISNA